VVLVEDQADVRAGELEVEGLLLVLLEGRLRVVVRTYKSQFSVALLASQLHEHLQQSGDFVLMEQQLDLLGSDWHKELNCDRLWVAAVYRRLPPLVAI
jgi:hypothetical protein